jgi:hypothetical protein
MLSLSPSSSFLSFYPAANAGVASSAVASYVVLSNTHCYWCDGRRDSLCGMWLLMGPQVIHDWIWSSDRLILTAENRRTRRKTTPSAALLCLLQIPHALVWAWTRTSTLGSRWLTAWASRLRGVVVSVLAIGPKGCGFEPGQGDGCLRAIKIHSTPSCRLESKAGRSHVVRFYGM